MKKKNIETPPCAKEVIFITEFAILPKIPPFYEVKKIFQKRLSAWRNFKNIFCRPHYPISFRPKIVFVDTDSILRVKTMYESVK